MDEEVKHLVQSTSLYRAEQEKTPDKMPFVGHHPAAQDIYRHKGCKMPSAIEGLRKNGLGRGSTDCEQ